MDGNNQNFDYFFIKFSDFDQIYTNRITFFLNLFYQIFDKIYHLVSYNQLKIHQ